MSKHKDHKALVGRVKKAVKKTRRKLSEEQFDKELQRTISFLADLKDHIGDLQAKAAAKQTKPTTAKGEAKPAKPAKAAPAQTAPTKAVPAQAVKTVKTASVAPKAAPASSPVKPLNK